MTRLVGVRAVCDGCSAAAAIVFCVSHRNVMCPPCDTALHDNQHDRHHQRVDLASAVTALPFCEHCDNAPATIYCESDGLTFCDKCDQIVHQSIPTAHWRTSIERTLRSRAVEFRVAPSLLQNTSQSIPKSNSSSQPSPPQSSSHQRQQISTLQNTSSSSIPMSIDADPSLSSTPPLITNQNQKSTKDENQTIDYFTSSNLTTIKSNGSIQDLVQPSTDISLDSSHQKTNSKNISSSTQNINSQKPPPILLRSKSYPRQNQRTNRNISLASDMVSHLSPRRRAAKALARKNNRRDAQKAASVTRSDLQTSSQLPTVSQPEPTPSILNTGDYGDLLNSQLVIGMADNNNPSYTTPISAFSSALAVPSHTFTDPLNMNNDAILRTETNPDPFGEDPDNMGLGYMMPYQRYQISNDDAQKRNTSAQQNTERDLEPLSSTRRESINPNDSRRDPDSNLQAPLLAIAAAAAAAGEQYLLNSVSSGSTSSRRPFTPPSAEIVDGPDPAGVAAAATAAAQSAVAGTDLGSSIHSTIQPIHPTTTMGSQGIRFKQENQGKDNSISFLENGNPPKSNALILAEQQISNEAVRKLGITKSEVQEEDQPKRNENEISRATMNETEERTRNERLHHISEGVDESLRNGDSLGELDIPRSDFDMFDSMDLPNFDRNGSISPDFAASDFRDQDRSLDLDDG